MTSGILFDVLVHLDPVQVGFDGQGHRLEFKVTGGKQDLSKLLGMGWPTVAEKHTGIGN